MRCSSGREAKGNEGRASTPTQAQCNDPYVVGEVKKWLDGMRRLDRDVDEQLLEELVGWLCRLI